MIESRGTLNYRKLLEFRLKGNSAKPFVPVLLSQCFKHYADREKVKVTSKAGS